LGYVAKFSPEKLVCTEATVLYRDFRKAD